jgi:purine catabolism regulator
MPVTLSDLLELPALGLSVVAGEGALDRPIRLVHTSELQDPTPWLSGGELLLTTGMALQGSEEQQDAYIGRLASAGLAGLGFGVGFGFDKVPAALARAAENDDFPVLEVPYPVPFIAIAEAVSKRLAEEQLRDAQQSIEIHERLASLVSAGAGPADVLDEVVDLAGGWAILYDRRGEVVARSARPEMNVPASEELWASLPSGLMEGTGPTTTSEMGPDRTIVGMGVPSGRRHEGVLVFGKSGRLAPRDRFVVRHAVTVLGLLLASRRAVVETERRIAGDVLNEAFAGRLDGADLERRLELVGFPPGAQVTAMVVQAPEGARDDLLDELAWALDGILGSRVSAVRTAVTGGRVAALMLDDEPGAVAEVALEELVSRNKDLLPDGDLRAAVGETTNPRSIRNSYVSAVLSLRAAPSDRRVASPRDLGSYGLLLGAQPRPVLEGFVRSVIGALIDRDRARSSELVPSIRAFIEAGGRWEPGAEALGIHRHTLRYRVRQAEELTGRDLSSAEDRLEIWLALKAADLLGQ